MLKHLYCAPTIKVATVETEDIMMRWSGGHEGTGDKGGSLTGDPIWLTTDNKPSTTTTDEESQGAKGISFDFE